MNMLASLLCLSLAAAVYALPAALGTSRVLSNNSTPLVIWHGLGDSHSSSGMVTFMSLIGEVHPEIFIHSVYVEEDLDKDQRAGWFGNANEQLSVVAEQLGAIPELRDGFDAIGFSQGGQFLRAYIERYNAPPVHNLITFGSQHMGISDFPVCKPYDVICRLARSAAGASVYSSWAQNNIIPAQYFRDPNQLSAYLSSNHFLTSINNEDPDHRNQTYAQNLASISNLILVLFTQDTTVVPKESAWFGSYAPQQEGLSVPPLVPMKSHPLYLEDWIGLKQLDQAGRVQFKSCEGGHMQMSRECWEPIVKQYVGQGSDTGDSRAYRGLRVQGS